MDDAYFDRQPLNQGRTSETRSSPCGLSPRYGLYAKPLRATWLTQHIQLHFMTDDEVLAHTHRARDAMEERKTELYGYMLWSARENKRLQELIASRNEAQKTFNIHLAELRRRTERK